METSTSIIPNNRDDNILDNPDPLFVVLEDPEQIIIERPLLTPDQIRELEIDELARLS